MDRWHANRHGPPSQRVIYWAGRVGAVSATTAVALALLGAKSAGAIVMGFAVCAWVASLVTALVLERREIASERREAKGKP